MDFLSNPCEVCGEREGYQDMEALFWLGPVNASYICEECRIDAGERAMEAAE